jgi:hypothetical protein
MERARYLEQELALLLEDFHWLRHGRLALSDYEYTRDTPYPGETSRHIATVWLIFYPADGTHTRALGIEITGAPKDWLHITVINPSTHQDDGYETVHTTLRDAVGALSRLLADDSDAVLAMPTPTSVFFPNTTPDLKK